MKTLIYCTKAKPYLFNETRTPLHNFQLEEDKHLDDAFTLLNGKVVASFELNEWEEVARTDYTRKISDSGLIPMMKSNGETYNNRIVVNMREDYEYDECKGSCLTVDELKAYGKGKPLYAWHIDNLQVFDEPVELGELYIEDNKHDTIIGMTKDFRAMYVFGKPVTKAPQSYQYVYYKGEKCLLLSVKSEHLVKILNGEKTIEIRKSVPKEVR